MKRGFLICCLAVAAFAAQKGVLLEDLTWVEAEKVLKPDTVMVIPIGAESKEHGPHLKLRNDFVMAEYFKKRILERADVVVAPTVNYHYYPAFLAISRFDQPADGDGARCDGGYLPHACRPTDPSGSMR